MSTPDYRRVARSWVERHIPRPARRVTPTEFQLNDLRLPVPEARFERAMMLFARHIGGTFNRHTGIIHLPKELTEGRRLPFTELGVLYRKYPCGMIVKNVREEDPVAGLPCVAFDVVPKVNGDPRRSKFYRSFQGDAATSKVLFNKFVAWLAILGRAIKRFRAQVEAGRPATFPRVASPRRVADRWLRIHAEGSARSGVQ